MMFFDICLIATMIIAQKQLYLLTNCKHYFFQHTHAECNIVFTLLIRIHLYHLYLYSQYFLCKFFSTEFILNFHRYIVLLSKNVFFHSGFCLPLQHSLAYLFLITSPTPSHVREPECLYPLMKHHFLIVIYLKL